MKWLNGISGATDGHAILSCFFVPSEMCDLDLVKSHSLAN
jgi:hypothetical protein